MSDDAAWLAIWDQATAQGRDGLELFIIDQVQGIKDLGPDLALASLVQGLARGNPNKVLTLAALAVTELARLRMEQDG